MTIFERQIIDNALLGTEKMPPQLQTLPEPIRAHLDRSTADNAETLFLQAATLVLAYAKTGTQIKHKAVADTIKMPLDERAFCPNSVAEAFKMPENSIERGIFHDAMQLCAKFGWQPPPKALVEAVMIYNEKKLAKSWLVLLENLIGERGRWLAELENGGNHSRESANLQQTWNEASLAERKVVWTSLRANEPDTAREWLDEAWATMNTKEHKIFIDLMQDRLSTDDMAFLERQYIALLQQKGHDKGVKSELKMMLVNLLLQVPESSIAQEVVAAIAPIFTKTKTLFGLGKAVLKPNFDNAPKTFFNETAMRDRFVRSSFQSTNTNYSHVRHWFITFMEYLSPQQLATAVDATLEEWIACLFGGKAYMEEKQLSYMNHALADAILRHRASDAAALCLEYYVKIYGIADTHFNIEPLFALLDAAEAERLLLSTYRDRPFYHFTYLLPERSWSPAVSKLYIDRCMEMMDNIYSIESVLKHIERVLPYLHRDATEHLESKYNRYAFAPSQKTVQAYEQISALLRKYAEARKVLMRDL